MAKHNIEINVKQSGSFNQLYPKTEAEIVGYDNTITDKLQSDNLQDAIGEIINTLPFDDFTGATSGSDGSKGLVPAPTTQDKDKFLKGDGSWSNVDLNLGGGYINVTAKNSLRKNELVYITEENDAYSSLFGKPDGSIYMGYVHSNISRGEVGQAQILYMLELPPYFRISALDANITVALEKTGRANPITLEYSLDGVIWNDYVINSQITLNNVGDVVLFRGDNTTFSDSAIYYYTFTSSGRVNLSGNIMSLLDKKCKSTTLSGWYVFTDLFYGLKVVDASKLLLPATTLTNLCYNNMFAGCELLTKAPELPATTLANNCYKNMFAGCESLSTAPDLPATTLVKQCYSHMFYASGLVEAPQILATELAESCCEDMFEECGLLTKPPVLPVTTLAKSCYFRMFYNCVSLTQAPELPATTLAELCYRYMFYGCESLIIAPELPATTLAEGCYREMFADCTSLIYPSDLPATTLTDWCYHYMFNGCTSLIRLPQLSATTLTDTCYRQMFEGCTSIKLSETQTGDYTVPYRIPTSGTGTTASNALYNMFGSTGGTFTGTPSINTTYYLEEYPELCFIAVEDGAKISLDKMGNPDPISLETSTDRVIWTSYTIGTTITLTNSGDRVYFRGNNSTFSKDPSNYYKFSIYNGKVATMGNVMSLLDKSCQLKILSQSYVFYKLFSNTDIISAPELPATTLTEGCYWGMFDNCRSLIVAPKLPATTLAEDCYASMFADCLLLKEAPELLANMDILPMGCYTSMFVRCTSLTKAPSRLPSQILGFMSYGYMFYGCTSLEQAPDLYFTAVANTYGCSNMFESCSKLKYIKLHYTGDFYSYGNNTFYKWVKGVAPQGDLYYNGSDTTKGDSAIPEGWTVHTF